MTHFMTGPDSQMHSVQGDRPDTDRATPRPWCSDERANNTVVIEGPDNPDATKPAEEYNGGKVICIMLGPDAAANAALIVRAVNAHDRLVEALDDARQWISQYVDGTGAEFGEAVAKVDAALALARGEQS